MSSLGSAFSKRSITQGVIIGLSLIALIQISPSQIAFADSAADVQAQIDQHNAAITQLNAEIAQYQQQLTVIGGQKQTLQTAIKTIDVSRAQTSTQVKVTQNQIGATDLQLTQIRGDISTKQQLITQDQSAVAKAIRNLQDASSADIIEQLFSADTLTEAWTDIDNTTSVTSALRTQVDVLSGAKVQLANQEMTASQTRDKLASLNAQLVAQQKSLDASKAAKADLLTQTQSKESSYQTLLAQKKAQEKTFETELSSLESKLKPVTASAIPKVGQGILAWPYSDTFAAHCVGISKALGNNYCITQYFGNTAFATANPSIYNGSGHNAIDIGMPQGTPVQAALTGTILGTGNTDLAHSAGGQQCLSFGKWVMIKHSNGLDTLYAHLSQISVTTGQAVSTGDVIGYSGMTGYATGPHLHFGVYASAGVQITTLGQYRGATTPCQNASLPISPVSGYLNPMSYL